MQPTAVSTDHIDLPPDLAGWVEILRTVKAKRAALDDLEAAAKQKIQDALGDVEEARIAGQPVARWTHVTPARRFDSKRFAKEQPDVYEQYVTVGQPGRRFTLLDDE
jgi:hypothetical protein